MTDPKISRARDAYRAYGQTTDFKNYQGLPMPAWEDLPEKIREAWVNASDAAARYHEPVAYYATDHRVPVEEEALGDFLRENVNRLRAAAARMESGEIASFALVFVPESDAPLYSYAVNGDGQGCHHRACAMLHTGLLTVARDVLEDASVSRLGWRHEEAAAKGLPVTTPSQDKAG